RTGRRSRGIGEDDDRRLESLGAVHRHHPYLVAGDLHIALHVGLRGTQPGNEALQRGRLAPLVVKGKVKELVDRIIGLGPEPGEKILAATFRSEHARIEREWRLAPSPVGIKIELLRSLHEARLLAVTQRRAQRSAPLPGDRVQIIVVETE